MLTNVHVKNLALIDDADIFFSDGLNVLSGETGAGKSILMGAIHLALGAKLSKEMIRDGRDEAYTELHFSIDSEEERKALEKLDIVFSDEMILTRKIVDNRSISRINGEAASVEKLKAAAAVLMDLHTQSEHQSLLFQKKQLDILDSFGKDTIKGLKEDCGKNYKLYKEAVKELSEFETDEGSRKREISLLEYEINEISTAALQDNEDEEVERLYKKQANSKKIKEELGRTYSLCSYDDGAGSMIGHAYSSLSNVSSFDDSLMQCMEQLSEIDSLLNDFNRGISDLLDDYKYDDEGMSETEKRLDLINHLKMKYGSSIEKINIYLNEQQKRLDMIQEYESNLASLKLKVENNYKVYCNSAELLSKARFKYAGELKNKILTELNELNFLQVDFNIDIENTNESASGHDKVVFMISFNPGQPLSPLERIASGGELSRFMLAVKSVQSDNDMTKTLLFDEIDAGISGITAQRVSEKLGRMSKKHQLICITHLPQIASMADRHFKIEKKAVEGHTATYITRLDHEGMIEELSRMLSGDEISSAVVLNANDLKNKADSFKKNLS